MRPSKKTRVKATQDWVAETLLPPSERAQYNFYVILRARFFARVRKANATRPRHCYFALAHKRTTNDIQSIMSTGDYKGMLEE